jgi:aerobic-type carbon monoxide dehydrogenase small subunit (CoxS/CutS family)
VEGNKRFIINGRQLQAEVYTRTSLLDLLREHLSLSGTKKGCDQGACGARTVLVDGERINSCLALAVQYQDRQVTTIEGLGRPDALHPLQAAFVPMTVFNVAIARQAKSVLRSEWSGRSSEAHRISSPRASMMTSSTSHMTKSASA